MLVEAAGLALIWLASGPVMAAAGAALTGFGYSLVYPGLGVEAVRRAPPESRGLAMGIYTAFLDVALGFGSPALGLIAGWAGPRLGVPRQHADRALRHRDRRAAARCGIAWNGTVMKPTSVHATAAALALAVASTVAWQAKAGFTAAR